MQIHSKRTNTTQGWREVGTKRIYLKSEWEAKYALHLEKLKQLKGIKEWEYEPKTFWFESIKRGVRSYKPDFLVTYLDGSHEWIEVKGYLDAKSQTKIKRFRKYYPNETLRVIDKMWFQKH
jgi:hypothetical protein